MSCPIDDALAAWRPASSWRTVLVPALERLARAPADGAAWAQIAMTLGDTRQPALCFIVCLYARRLGQTSEVDDRLSAHMALAAGDLGGIPQEQLHAWLATQGTRIEDLESVVARVLDTCRARIQDAPRQS